MDPHGIDVDRTRARRWFLLAVLSLVLSGTLSLLLVVGRLPPLDRLITDPLLFRRALVVHVDLALVVWFHAFTAGLLSLVPTRGPSSPVAGADPFVALAGVVLLIASAGAPGAQPVLANYLPVIDTPAYLAGLAAIALGLLLAIAGPRLLPGAEASRGVLAIPAAARVGLRAAALALGLALLTFAGSWLTTPQVEAYYELLFWGGGHVLQIAAVAAMLSAWTILLAHALGRPPVSRGVAVLLFGALLLPALAAPALAMAGSATSLHRVGFTRMMQWGVFPPVLVYLALCLRSLVSARRPGLLRDGRVMAFAASAGLTLLGFVLGAMIRGSNTMVPAHYHASIGAVTASFMGLAYVLLEPLGVGTPSARERRLSRWQPALFGAGQAVFAVGFGLAGAHGMARKAYGAEQAARTLPETVGLVVMGAGGAVAVIAGLAFLWIVIASWRRARAASFVTRALRRLSWTNGSQLSRS